MPALTPSFAKIFVALIASAVIAPCVIMRASSFGILGEYIGAIYTHVKNKPYVIEDELINFDDDKIKDQRD